MRPMTHQEIVEAALEGILPDRLERIARALERIARALEERERVDAAA